MDRHTKGCVLAHEKSLGRVWSDNGGVSARVDEEGVDLATGVESRVVGGGTGWAFGSGWDEDEVEEGCAWLGSSRRRMGVSRSLRSDGGAPYTKFQPLLWRSRHDMMFFLCATMVAGVVICTCAGLVMSKPPWRGGVE